MAEQNMIQTTCAYCGVGCGITARVKDRQKRQLIIKGDPEHPANQGKLCSKGSALADTVSLSGRLLYPKVDNQRTTWSSAIERVAKKFNFYRKNYGPDAIAFYVSGQLLTEDYYVANKLIKGFLGSANIDTNSRLCMASSVAGHKRAFGMDTVPGCYDDIDHARLIVLTGSNTAWCHPIIYQRIQRARDNNPDLKVVLIDPRKTATADLADLHLAIEPGADTWLFNGLLAHLVDNNQLDHDFLQQHTDGFEAALARARSAFDNIEQLSQLCGLRPGDIQQFFTWFCQTECTITMYSQGVNQSSCGTDKVNAIINCHLVTGRIGRQGMGPFSLTGQPNAMGGREVGGLANTLAAHQDFSDANVARMSRFWNSDNVATQPGLKAVDMFDAIRAGKIKAVWIMATNPVVSLPEANKVADALKRCDFVVVSDCIEDTDTNRLAHVKLPALAWSEKEGTVTNSERRISRQRRLLDAPGEARADWKIICDVAQSMGFDEGFNFTHVSEVFTEHAALSGYENGGDSRRDFDISQLETMSAQDYEQMQPVQWPVNAQYPEGRARFFADGQFFTATGKAQLVAVDARPLDGKLSAEYPLRLNTGRVRDQWHTMTRTALSPKLNVHMCEPFVELNTTTAQRYGIQSGHLAELSSKSGRFIGRVKINEAIDCKSVFAPMHWTDQTARLGKIGALVNAVVDPVSGQPELKHTAVALTPFAAQWYGLVVTANQEAKVSCDYAVHFDHIACRQFELAGLNPLSQKKDVVDYLEQNQLLSDSHHERLEFFDEKRQIYRLAILNKGKLELAVYLAPEPVSVDRSWIRSLFNKMMLADEERSGLLAGRLPRSVAKNGDIVCACFAVGKDRICAAVRDKQLTTLEQVTQSTQAGSNCGSCLPEIAALLAASPDGEV